MDSPKYVVGFLFRNEGKEVALIRKEKPEWQKGKLNGVGGKIEPGENSFEAMEREFKEETGAVVTLWRLFVALNCDGVFIDFFCSHEPAEVRTTTNELVEWWRVSEVLNNPRTIPNLKWLIPMALDPDKPSAQVYSEFSGK